MTIDMMPDDVLIDIFHSDRIGESRWRWERLAHVCRRWRRIVFSSPHSLHLRLVCNERTRIKEYLDTWPPFPIAIQYILHYHSGVGDGLIAAINHPDRVCDIQLNMTTAQHFGKLATVMQQPFPVLTRLTIRSWEYDVQVLGGFLGGSAPSLRDIELNGVSFPELPTLLLSTCDLVTLELTEIPPSGYISTEAMVTGLAGLTRLNYLYIGFKRRTPRVEQKNLHPLIRTVLPALTCFYFGGDSDYLEDFVSRIDCPRLNRLKIGYKHRLDDFQVSQLFEFFNRSEVPRVTSFGWVGLCDFSTRDLGLKLYDENRSESAICIKFNDVSWHASHLVQVFAQFSANLADVRDLNIDLQQFESRSDLGYNQCAQLLLPFTSVQTLWVSGIRAFNDVAEAEGLTTRLLPALESLYLLGYTESHTASFKTAFRLSGRSITIVNLGWEPSQEPS